MKRYFIMICTLLCCCILLGCNVESEPAQIIATTLPVYDFTQQICSGTNLKVSRLISEDIACLHDYSLKVSQMQALESANIIISSGAGLEDFLTDIETGIADVIDLSAGIPLHCEEHHHHHEDNDHADPHYWLSPNNSKIMATNICQSLIKVYPQYQSIFESNLDALIAELDALQNYADSKLNNLSTRKLITFHDGFSYMADAFDLEIVHCVTEESGSEASAQELIELTTLVKKHNLPAIFTEKNGSTSAATIIARETHIKTFPLDMAMSGDSYFDAMYQNIDILKEALE